MNQVPCRTLTLGATFSVSIIQKGGAYVADFTDESIMPFGDFKGIKMAEVPKLYLQDLYKRICGTRMWGSMKKVHDYIETNAEKIGIEIFKRG